MVGKYDIVLMMDVLEHIPDDTAFFEAACAHLKPGGHIIVGVPANGWMYSKYDQVVGHFRRYSPKGLRKVFLKNDTKVLRGSFWGLSLVPISILRKFWLLFVGKEKIVSTGFKPPSPLFNSLFLWLMRLELTFFQKPPLGISYMMMGKLEDNYSRNSA
jgi:SAM-dependent methyltransferase